MATLFDVLGSRLQRELTGYNATTGTWTCDRGSGNATQSTAAKRPSAGSTPSGQSCPVFDASSTAAQADYLEIPTLTTIPAFNNAHNRLFAVLFRYSGVMPHGASILYRCVDTYGITFDGRVEACGSKSNDVIAAGAWHTLIVWKNGAGAVSMALDGVTQTQTGTGQLGQDWRQYSGVLGCRENGDYPHGGELAKMAFAYSTTTAFSGTDITNVHAALAEFLAAGGGGGPVSIAVSSAGVASTAAALSVSRRLAASVVGAAATAAAARIARRVSASASGAALTSVMAKRTAGLSASSAGAATTTAAATCRRSVQPSSSAGATVTPTALRVARALSASSPGAASAAAAIRLTRRLSASASGQAVAVASLRIDRRLIATANGVGSTQLELTVEGANEVVFAASAAGVATATATIRVTRRLSAVATASASALQMAIRVQRRATATSSGAGSTSAHASVVRGFAATSSGFATAIAAIIVGDEAAVVPAGYRVTAVAFVATSTVRVDSVSSRAVILADAGSPPAMFVIKRNDREPPFRAKLFQDDAPAPLAGATVKFHMKAEGAMPSAAPKVSAPATIVDPVLGIVRYDWAEGDTNVTGLYRAEFEVTYANGKTRTFPGEGYLPVRIVSDLG